MDDGDEDDYGSPAPSTSGPSAGMMLKAKMAPHLIHDHEWEAMASQIQPRRLFDGSTEQPSGLSGLTGLKPVVSASDAPVDPSYRQQQSSAQTADIKANRAAALRGTPNQGGTMTRPIAEGVSATVTVPASPASPITKPQMSPAGTPVGVPPVQVPRVSIPAAPRREATNPLTGDQTPGNNTNSGVIAPPAALRPTGPRFSNPTSASIYGDHIKKLFNPATPRKTGMRRIRDTVMA